MDSKILKFICQFEGFKTAIKSLHWDSKNLSQHKLCDDIAERISDFQDQVSEVEQSISGNLPLNKLKPISYKVKDLKSFVEDVIKSTNKFYRKVKNMGIKYVGMASDCESFLSDMQRNLYLVRFTIKEDFKRNYKQRINEMKNNKKINLTYNQLENIISEAVIKTLNEGCCEAEVKGGDYNDKELNFTHFAVNKYKNLIVDGWNYSGYDTEELKQFKNDYFHEDLKENGFNPKAYKILSFKACQKQGIDPNNQQNWSNSGLFPLDEEQIMIKNGENPTEIAREKHPDWFV